MIPNTEKTPEEVASNLEASLKDMQTNLKIFSLTMRSLYAEQNVGTSTEAARKFTKLRDKTKDDAKLYLKVILPVTTQFVSSIKDFCEFYDSLSYEKWCDMLPSIVEEVRNHKDLAETLKQMHENMAVTLKKREDEAKIVMTEFKNLQCEYEEMKKEYESTAKTRCTYAYILAFIPVVNVIACPLLKLSADEFTAKALAKKAEWNTQGAAALAVAQTLIPALSKFIDGLTQAAGFFEVMEVELGLFIKRGATSCETLMEAHYKMMRKKVKKIQPSTYEYFSSLPAVRTDFDTIPDEGTDHNYIEKWLEERLTEIAKKRNSTRNAFWKVVSEIRGLSLVLKPHLCESVE